MEVGVVHKEVVQSAAQQLSSSASSAALGPRASSVANSAAPCQLRVTTWLRRGSTWATFLLGQCLESTVVVQRGLCVSVCVFFPTP